MKASTHSLPTDFCLITPIFIHISFISDNEKPMRVVDDEDLVDQHLISDLRKEYGMTYNDFFMVLTDVDLRVKV